jgi:hypothetical protein
VSASVTGTIVQAGNSLAAATKNEMDLINGKAEAKVAAILRLMANGPNPLSKGGILPHSASSAEEVVSTDPEYRAYLDAMTKAVVLKIQAQAAYDAALALGRMSA